MTETNEHHDATSEEHPQLVELLSRLVDGGFTPEDQQQLESLLQARPDLRAYYIEYLSTWALLDAELAPKPVALQKDDAPPRATASTAARPIAGRIGTLRYAAAAVITIGAITAALLIQELDAPRELGSVAVTAPHTDDAVLTYAENATWDGDRPEDGSRVQAPLRLKSGRAQLLFDGGAVATLEGDAAFHVLGDNAATLTRGAVTVDVPPRARGFTLYAGPVRVVDLGTRFGVDINEQDDVEVHVLDGRVELHWPDHKVAPVTLVTQQAMRVAADGGLTRDVPFTAHYFDGWASTDESITATGDVYVMGAAPPSLDTGRLLTGDRIYVVPERRGVTLAEPIANVIAQPGRHVIADGSDRDTIPAGTRCNSYLMHFEESPKWLRTTGGSSTVTAKVRFPRPVLGVVVRTDTLAETDTLFLPDGVESMKTLKGRGLESLPDRNADIVRLSADRRTLTVTLTALLMDELRVLVEDAPAETTDTD